MDKKTIQKLEESILDTFNKGEYILNDVFLRDNLILATNKNNLVAFIKHPTLKNTFVYPNTITAFIITKNKNSFNYEQIGYLIYNKRPDVVKISQIEIFDNFKNQGYGTLLLKAFETNISKSYNKAIDITGSFAPKKIDETLHTKSFYNKNGYKVKMFLRMKKPIIKKHLKIKNVEALHSFANFKTFKTKSNKNFESFEL